MNIVFVSNYYNHHQKEFSEQMNSLTNGKYHFIETENIDEERLKLGWGEKMVPAYVHNVNKNEDERKVCLSLIKNADIIVTGSASEKYLISTHFKKKLVFRYAERPFKQKKTSVKYLVKLFILELIKNFSLSRTYMLCASGYTASDYKKIGFYRNKTYKWGYFPPQEVLNTDEIMLGKIKNEILWCGRFLDWKHPELVVLLADALNNMNVDFHINMIGMGPMKNEIVRMIEQHGLINKISILESMTPDQIRDYMKKSEIYLFTSDQNEGWGAVLNEAMNSCCAVVASDAAGATPFLIKDNENGIIYSNGNRLDFVSKVIYIIEHPEKRKRMSEEAYNTIFLNWNAQNAASRFFNLCQEISSREKYPELYCDGPCSRI